MSRAGFAPVGMSSRAGSLAIALVCFSVLAIAAWLKPAQAGHGTHRQLGMPECAWVVWFNKPCLTCGMTTAFSHAAHLDFLASIRAQPAGFLLCMLTAATFWIALYVACTGSRIGAVAARLISPRSAAVLAAVLLLAWVYKIVTWN